MVQAFLLALRQLFEPPILWVVAKVVLLTLGLFLLLGVAGYYALLAVAPQLGYTIGGGESALISFLVTFCLCWFLFRAVAIFVMGIFSDEVVDLVERKYFPAAAARAKPVGIGRGMKLGLASAGRAIGYNLLALPVYIGLLVTGVGMIVAVIAVNGLLLGRDLQDMVMARHRGERRGQGRQSGISRDEINPDAMMRPLARPTRIALGLIVALLFLVPFVNLLAPVLGAAMAVHLVHAREGRASARTDRIGGTDRIAATDKISRKDMI